MNFHPVNARDSIERYVPSAQEILKWHTQIELRRSELRRAEGRIEDNVIEVGDLRQQIELDSAEEDADEALITSMQQRVTEAQEERQPLEIERDQAKARVDQAVNEMRQGIAEHSHQLTDAIERSFERGAPAKTPSGVEVSVSRWTVEGYSLEDGKKTAPNSVDRRREQLNASYAMDVNMVGVPWHATTHNFQPHTRELRRLEEAQEQLRWLILKSAAEARSATAFPTVSQKQLLDAANAVRQAQVDLALAGRERNFVKDGSRPVP